MTTFLLIRHASHDWLGKGIAGRMQGVHLNARGRAEAQALAEHLRHIPVAALYSSPLARTWETAGFLAREWKLDVRYHAGFLEIDFGRWTGLPFDKLDRDLEWSEWNNHRSHARVPLGEAMREVQARALDSLGELAREHPDSHVAIVSHGDVIRAVLLDCLGRSLDEIHQLQADPASVTLIDWLNEGDRRVTAMNFPGAQNRMPYPLVNSFADPQAIAVG